MKNIFKLNFDDSLKNLLDKQFSRDYLTLAVALAVAKNEILASYIFLLLQEL